MQQCVVWAEFWPALTARQIAVELSDILENTQPNKGGGPHIFSFENLSKIYKKKATMMKWNYLS